MRAVLRILRAQGLELAMAVYARPGAFSGRHLAWALAMAALILLSLVPLVGGLFVGTAGLLAATPAAAHPLLLGAWFTVALAALALFAPLYAAGVFFNSRDSLLLQAWPLAPWQVVAVRLFWVYLGEGVTAAVLLVPVLAAYALTAGQLAGAFRGLVLLFLVPWVPLGPAAALVLALARLAGRRAAQVVHVLSVASGLGLAACFLLLFRTEVHGDAVTTTIDPAGALTALAERMALGTSRLAPGWWAGRALTGDLLAWLLILAVVGAGLALTLWLTGRHLFRLAVQVQLSPPRRASARERERARTALALGRPALAALVWRETVAVLRTPVWLVNVGIAPLLPAFLAAPILLQASLRQQLPALAADPAGGAILAAAQTAILILTTAATALGATALSREGRGSFWLLAWPLAPTVTVDAKLLGALWPAVAAAVVCAGALVAVGAGTPLALSGTLGALVAGAPLPVAVGLLADLLWPRIFWQNPAQALKGNLNSLWAMLALLPLLGTAAWAGWAVARAMAPLGPWRAWAGVASAWAVLAAAAAMAWWACRRLAPGSLRRLAHERG